MREAQAEIKATVTVNTTETLAGSTKPEDGKDDKKKRKTATKPDCTCLKPTKGYCIFTLHTWSECIFAL